jgi:hypothetical protein
MNRSYQRQTQVFDSSVSRMIAVNATIRARHTCFYAAFWFEMMASSRRRAPAKTVMDIPIRIPQNVMTNP